MKRLVLLVSLVLLSVVGTTTTTQAYYLDTPHNESNGIYCFTCHFKQPLWRKPPAPGAWVATADPDYTLHNAICQECHAATSTHVNQGPAKKPHSKTATQSQKADWTTNCTQCHDVHAQGQLDYADTADAADLYLAWGQYSPGATANFVPDDIAGGNCKNIVQPNKIPVPKCGTTTVGINVASITGTGTWTNTSLWDEKGGKVTATNALDGTRGLVFVANKTNPRETFEIISVGPGDYIKVKGKMTSSAFDPAQPFGVIYGQSIKSYVMPNGGTTINDIRQVKFFQPGLIPGTDGGYVDLTPGETEPKGLCQVCHTSAIHWRADGTLPHETETACSTCHNVINGGGSEVIKIHTTYIEDTSVGTICLPCHDLENIDPDSNHNAGCQVCHVSGAPTLTACRLNSNVIANEGATTVLGALLSAGYTYNIFGANVVERLQDSDGTDIQPTGGNGVFTKIACTVCHFSKIDAVGTGAHGGHLDSPTVFVWDQVCRDCHDPGATLSAYKDIHGNGTKATCTLCHAQSGIDNNTYYPRRTGPNGTAEDPVTSASTCIDCHTAANTSGFIHHDTPDAVAGACTACHVGATHGGDHTLLVRDYVNCTTCHFANAGNGLTSPIDANYLVLDDPKLHDSCLTCHKLTAMVDGGVVSLKTLADYPGPYPSVNRVNAMPNPTGASNDGGGYCWKCHGEYFANHTHTLHTTSMPTLASCNSAAPCHTTGNVVSVVHGNNCDDCHNMVTGVRVNGAGVGTYLDAINVGDATLGGGAGGNCVVCHPAYFAAHLHPHLFSTVPAACATNCHATTVPPGSDALIAPNSATPYTANTNQVHGRLGCTFCHSASTGVRITSGWNTNTVTAIPGSATSCVDCHTPTWVAMHSDPTGFNAVTGIKHDARVAPLAACTSCHPSTAGGLNGVMPVDPAIGDAADRKHNACVSCHTTTGSLVTSGWNTNIVIAVPAGGGNCGTCHSPTYFDSHTHDHSSVVTYDALTDKSGGVECNTCHLDYSFATFAGIVSEHTPGGCARCHSYSAGIDPEVGTNTLVLTYNPPAIVHCLTCHVVKSASHGGHTADFAKTPSCTTAPCHQGANVVTNIHLNACGMCHTSTPELASNVGPVAAYTSFGIDGDADGATGAASAWASYDCLSCHTAGNNTNNFTSTGGIHHVNKNSNVTCATAGCHTVSKLAHTTSVATETACSSCHDNAAGGSARNAITAPFVATGSTNDVHYLAGTGGGCDACHTLQAAPGSGGILRTTPLAGNTNLVLSNGGDEAWLVGTNGGGTCSTCHKGPAASPYFAAHTNASHVSLVQTTPACSGPSLTAPCHQSGVVGTTTTAPVDATPTPGNSMHDACSTCHLATTGLLLSTGWNTNTVSSMSPGSSATNDGGGLCTNCHGPYPTLDNHNHHNAGATTNMVFYDAVNDKSAGTTCNTCHIDFSFASWSGILSEHTGGCARCHSYTTLGAFGDPVVATNTAVLAYNTTVNCLTCHVAKSAAHGGHSADFTKTTTCTTAPCHQGANVVTDIHAATPCGAMCHTAEPHTAANVGPVAAYTSFGIDGDADGATGAASAWASYDCLSCHAPLVGTNNFTSTGGIHHVNKNSNVTCATGGCHTASKLDHTTSVATDTACSSCHDNAAGGSARNAITAPFVATGSPNDVHYLAGTGGGCDACHTLQAAPGSGGILRTTPLAGNTNLVLSNGGDEAWLVGTNGGGTCSTCHKGPAASPYFAAHTNANHVSLVQTTPACSGATLTAPCHQSGVVGTTTTAPVDATPTPGNSMHDACSTCHLAATGVLVTGGWNTNTVSSMSPGSSATNDGGGLCTNCHGPYPTLDNHNHHNAGATTNMVFYAPGSDQSVGTDCGVCHNEFVLTTWAGILNEHTGGCARCHNYTDLDGTEPVAATNTAVLAYNTTVNCLTCHVAKTGAHGGHAVTDFQWQSGSITSCGAATCHNAAANTNVVTQIHGNAGTIVSPGTTYYQSVSGTGCQNCHDNKDGGNLTTIGRNGLGTGYTGDARIIASGGPANDTTHTELCTTCHTLSIPATHHNRDFTNTAGRNVTPAVTSRVQAGQCQKCHTDGASNASYVYPYKKGTSNATGLRPAVTPCEYCHLEVTPTGFKVKIYRISRILVTNSDVSIDPFTGSYTHVFENKMNTTPGSSITDWGVCFYCHGSTGVTPRSQESGATSAARIYPKHAFYPAMVETSERNTRTLPRLRVHLHPGHLKYNLIATRPNVEAATEVAGSFPMNDRFGDGSWNKKLYDQAPFDTTANGAIVNGVGDTPKAFGKSGNAVYGWNPSGLDVQLGSTHVPVAVKSPPIPYTIGSAPYGVDIPATP